MKYIATVVFFLSFFPLVWSQSENKGWKFLHWGMSEKEAEATVLQVTRQQPLWQENVLSFPYEGVFVTCYFDKGLSRIVETQEFHYPDSAQTAQAFDSHYHFLADKLGEAIIVHHKASCSKIVSWKFGVTRIKLLFNYASQKCTRNRLQLEMTYWCENLD